MKKIFAAVFAIIISNVVLSQDSTVKMFGKIFDQKMKPIEIVMVELKGTKFQTKSDREGHYFFMLPASKGTLVYSHKGYQTKEIEFTGTPQANDLILVEEKKKMQDFSRP